MISLRTREGTRVRFEPIPASYALYSSPPARGATGSVTTVSFGGGGGRRTHLPGPGGGLVYVKWDDGSFQGVSSIDLVKLSSKLEENPEGSGAVLAVMGIAALGLGWLFMSEKKASAAPAPAPAPTPSAPACPSATQVKAFAVAKSLTWFTSPTPPTAPPTNAQWTPEARVFSTSNCTFYKWMLHEGAPSAWVKDDVLTIEMLMWAQQSGVQGVAAVAHPFVGIPVPT